jgi:hypothetical protein
LHAQPRQQGEKPVSDETAKEIAESCTVEVTDEDGVVIAFATLAAVAMAIIITITITTMTITAKSNSNSNSSNSSTIMMEST